MANNKNRWKLVLVVCATFGGFTLPNARAAAEPYLQIGDGSAAYVYRWLLPDGTVLKQGMTDPRGKAFLVKRPGKTEYILEAPWGRYKVHVAAECWKATGTDFGSCAKISAREDTEAIKQEAAKGEQEYRARQEQRASRAAWVDKDIPRDRHAGIIDATLNEHRTWLQTPMAQFPDNGYSCQTLKLPAPSPEAARWFDKAAALPKGSEQDRAYIKAAESGHWRAAARLASTALNNEDWEAAQPVIAWLLDKHVPSGYAKLADLIAATASYDGMPVSESTRRFVTSLRWRAAQLGDPVAQAQMSRHLMDQGNTQTARDLLACAQRQNPDIR